jgi:RecA-family ATPase
VNFQTPAVVPLNKAPRKLLNLTIASDLANKAVPERPWLAQDWIPDRAVTLLGGDGGVGKSLLALQLMIACNIGKPWMGLEVAQRKSLALFCEDDEIEVHLRLDALCQHYGVEMAALTGVRWSARSGRENVLMSFGRDNDRGTATPLWHETVQEVLDTGTRLVIIDTLADTFGGQENFRSQARAFINLLRSLALRMPGGGAVLLTAHPSLTGQNTGTGLSGSTAWNNSVRSRLYLTRPQGEEIDADHRILKRMKANYASAKDEIRMTWQHGALVAESFAGGINKIAMDAKIDRLFIETLSALNDQGRRVGHSFSANYAPKVFAALPAFQGIGKRVIERSMERLFAAGKIKIEKEGPPSRAIEKLVAS